MRERVRVCSYNIMFLSNLNSSPSRILAIYRAFSLHPKNILCLQYYAIFLLSQTRSNHSDHEDSDAFSMLLSTMVYWAPQASASFVTGAMAALFMLPVCLQKSEKLTTPGGTKNARFMTSSLASKGLSKSHKCSLCIVECTVGVSWPGSLLTYASSSPHVFWLNWLTRRTSTLVGSLGSGPINQIRGVSYLQYPTILSSRVLTTIHDPVRISISGEDSAKDLSFSERSISGFCNIKHF